MSTRRPRATWTGSRLSAGCSGRLSIRWHRPRSRSSLSRRTPCAAPSAAWSCCVTSRTRPSPRARSRAGHEAHLSAVFEKYCTSGMTVVDVGANLGYYSVGVASRLVGPTGRVVALEPNSENCRLLLSSLRLNDITNVQLLPVAADRATGWAYYSTHVGSNGGLIDDDDLLSHPGTVVPTFPLDELVEGPVGFLKMDVEGEEGRVVEGATCSIARDRPIVTTELKDEMLRRVSGTTVADYLGSFEKLGYRPSLLEKATGCGEAVRLGRPAPRRLGRDRRIAGCPVAAWAGLRHPCRSGSPACWWRSAASACPCRWRRASPTRRRARPRSTALHFSGSFVPLQLTAAAGRMWVVGSNGTLGSFTQCQLEEVTPATMATHLFALPACPTDIAATGGMVEHGRGCTRGDGQHPRDAPGGLRPRARPGAADGSRGDGHRRQRHRPHP